MSKLSTDEINAVSNISVLDYFNYLESQGKVDFIKKNAKDVYFTSGDRKISVTNDNFYDVKNEVGGKIIKAVMVMENKSWKDSVEFLKDFSGFARDEDIVRKNAIIPNREIKEAKITSEIIPNNRELLNYFESRGISTDILKNHTKQIHFQSNEKNYFGIGIKNVSGGYDIRNPMMKKKIGTNDFSILQGNKDEIIVFEGMTNTLSFLQLLKMNNASNNKTIITLNSTVNANRFIEQYHDFKGKLLLCLDGDKEGNKATSKIMAAFPVNTKDVRLLYNINEGNHEDLNDYLKYKLQINQINLPQNADRQNTLSNIEQNESKRSRSNFNTDIEDSKSNKRDDIGERQGMVSNNVGDGFENGKEPIIGRGSDDRSINSTQYQNAEKENTLGRGLEKTTNIDNLDHLIIDAANRKITNEIIEAIVNEATTITDDKKILLKPDLIITEELLTIVNQYKSGGVAKEGRGILDEYYTDNSIVDAVRNLIKNNFKNLDSIKVLEPSIGTGNFVNATNSLAGQAFVTGFEINETTAKIAKLFHPHIDINLRSFETEFISENGVKTPKNEFEGQYDLVIGNPPYGDHRGLYKGLGEESKISKYEDYFVKRGLDVLKNNGVLAMVLPSVWLKRQKQLKGAEIINAFRLPAGAFQGTQIGTDIIILQKQHLKQAQDISSYFDLNPDKILGEVKERTNRFGREELFVNGTLEEALDRLSKVEDKKNTVRLGDLFEDFFRNPDFAEEKKEIELVNEDSIIDINLLKKEATKIVCDAFDNLNEIHFKTPAIKAQLISFKNIKIDSLSINELNETIQNAEKVLTLYNSKNRNEYTVQSSPEIQKGIIKYQFTKQDEIIDTSIHNSSDLNEKQVAAFKATSYDGTINNYTRHFGFANYYNGDYIHDFYYAEGNIYQKLEQLEKDYSKDWGIGGLEKKQYEKQKSLLESVLPKQKTLDEISISPNHEFVLKFDLGQIEKESWNPNTRQTEPITVNYNLADKFKDFVGTLSSEAFAGSSAWEVRSFVDNETVTGSDKERNSLVRERRKIAANDLFNKFIREELPSDLRERFINDFNKNYNNIHVPDYSQFPLVSKIHKNFKGTDLQLTGVQKAGIGRQTTKGVGLLAHEVGFGKTLSGILSMHEAMERGNAKRPLIIVPNESILKQWVDTIFEVIPNAKVNVLGNLGKEYDLSKFNNKDGEISIVTYSGFNNIGFSNEITERLASKFNYISSSELKSITNSERDIQKELLKEKEVEGKMKRGKVYDWEDFKFDHMTYDEVHNANHIVGKVKIEDRRFSSDFRSQNQQTSKLGINTWMAAQYIQEQQNGRNVTLLSATPFTNKPLEYYSILSLIANKRLEESGYLNVNTFFETFMEADNEMEIDAKGDIKFKSNVRRFKNNSLFQQLLSEFIDIKGEEDNLELVRPNKINKEYKIEQNYFTAQQYSLLNDNFRQGDPGAILTHILNARLIAISPYLSPYNEEVNINVKSFVEESPKLLETMRLIAQNKKDIPHLGQIIYSELAVSSFQKLKDYLVTEVGYDSEEVAIISGETSKAKRVTYQDQFNEGKIKVIIGSEAIQEGMNLQIRTSDMYFLSLPYNFTSLRQVEGRGWRQGNINENIRMNFMLTNDSIDVFMLQKLQAKQSRYLEAMKKGANVLDISDISTSDLKTSIITNPETRANIEIEIIKKRLESEKNRFIADSAFVLRKYEEFNKINIGVNKAQEEYNRILGYTKNDNDNSDYWKTQLPSYKKNIEYAKETVALEIVNMSKKGVNVVEIERQIQVTDQQIGAIDKKIEDLDKLHSRLVEQYKIEKEIQLSENKRFDIVAERKNENDVLFIKSKLKNEDQPISVNYTSSIKR